jgi:hypothetical protein
MLGLMGWVSYTAYGLASLPITLLKARGDDGGCCKKRGVGAPLFEGGVEEVNLLVS